MGSKQVGAIENIVILGGGSAGWMSASYLAKVFESSASAVDICLIEAPDVGTIGVGGFEDPPTTNMGYLQ